MSNKKDVINKSFYGFIKSENSDIWEKTLVPFFKSKEQSIVINIKFYYNQELHWWKLNLDKVIAGKTFAVVGVAVDISNEIRLQAEAKKSEASKSIFLANMSHEIRTPIHTVTGLTELLKDTKLDGEQGEYVSQIGFAAKVLLTLINDILDFSKIEAGKLTFENIEYNLYDTILTSIDLSTLEAHKKGVDVAISIDEKMPMNVFGDQVRLRQILVNLMSNAVKFTKVGEIILEVKTKIIDDKNVLLKFSVIDSGIGISKDKQSKLFKAFSQADTSTTRQFGGTGLGLSISSSLVSLMNGVLGVISEEGKGASFFFEIPVVKGVDPPPKFVNPPIENLKALVVDDNKKVNKIFSDILRSWNYDVVEVYTVMDALNELIIKATLGEPYDVCFIDQILPGMDGWQLAGEIQSNSLIKTTKTLLMSLKGKGTEESKMKLLGWFQGYITKPVCKGVLYKTLDDLYKRTLDVEMDDDIEELESLVDDAEDVSSFIDDDDEYMEPLRFSENAYEELEHLETVTELEDLSDFMNIEEIDLTESKVGVEHYTPKESYTNIPDNKTPQILVVEDHLVNQKLFKIILEKLGHKVYVANDGLEAVEIVEKTKLDLVFMDCQMPVMNGYTSSEIMRAKGYTLPIIAVTASAVQGEYDKCIESGMSDVMTKPFKKEDVMASLKKWLRNKDSKKNLFDYEKALERFMGEKEILLDVLPSYIENLFNCIDELKTLDNVNDTTRIREVAHSIKGSSLNLDIVAIGKEAGELEDLAFNKKSKDMPKKIEKIIELANLTKVELQKYL